MREYEPPPRRRPSNRRPPQRRRHKQTLSMQPIILACLIIIVVTVTLIWRRTSEEYTPVLAPVEYLHEVEHSLELVSMPVSFLTDTGYLKLVNRDLAMSRPVDYSNIVDAWPTVPVRATDITVHQTLLGAVAALFAEADDIPFFVTSGYRNVYRQHEIYENAEDRMYVMPPGHSEHNIGLAVDILVMDVPMSQMSGTPEARWLAQNAWRHGMILRYPYGTTHITGVAYEPWHFRYVGLVHAWYMTVNNMVLEEYLAHLEAQGSFAVRLNGVTYHIMYQQLVGGHLYVPLDLPFNISTSNRGGYVVTVWED